MDTIPTDETPDYEEWKRALHTERGQRVREALAKKREKGEPTGCAPVGYKNAVVDGRRVIVPDEQTALLVRETFELAATGRYSLRQLLAVMTEKGLRSRNGKPMGVSALRSMLTNPFYTGYLQRQMHKILGTHEPLIEEEVFSHLQMQSRKNTSVYFNTV